MPIYIAEKLSTSLASMMIISGLLSSFFTITGLIISYNYDLTTGACIIMVSALFLSLFIIANKLKNTFFI